MSQAVTGDGQTVFTTAQGDYYHLDRDCTFIKNSDTVQAKPLKVLFADAEPCGHCGGES
jgi:hypothetical protein